MMNDRDFRDAMGKFSTGVTVITTKLNGQIYGLTANAFMSVSLDPKLVLISLMKESRTLPIIKKSETFAVNILADDQLHVSKAFASKEKDLSGITFEELDGLPVVPGSLAQISCEIKSEYEEGDHILIVGRVMDLKLEDGEPLIFSSGKFRELKEVEEVASK